MLVELPPAPKIWSPQRPAIIRAARLPYSPAEARGLRLEPPLALGLGGSFAANIATARGPLVVVPPVAVSTSFTFTGTSASDTAAEANIYNGTESGLNTSGADPAGLNANTRAAYQFSIPRAIRRIRSVTNNTSGNGWANATVFLIQYSGTNLTSGFSTVSGGATTHSITNGLGQVNTTDFDFNGYHLYWRIFYSSGTTGGNAWLAELQFLAHQ